MSGWVRLWHDMPTDPKWRVIARKSGQPLACVLAVFTMMIVSAGQNTEQRGELCGWDDEDAGAALDMDGSDVAAIREAMQGKVLNGNQISGWESRQPKREDNSVGRVRAYRERKASERNTETPTATPPPANVTQCNAPEADAEPDTERLEPNGSCPSGDEPSLKPEHVVETWNDLAKRLGKPTVRDLTPERRQRVKARIAGYSLDDWRTVLGNVETSPFLRGDTGWHGFTFDWMTKKANFQKVLEGNYNG